MLFLYFFYMIFLGLKTERRIKKMELEEKSARLIRAEEKAKRANAELEKIKKDEKHKMRKMQDAHKFMMGGAVAKFFPRCYNFSKLEMNRIISYALNNASVSYFIERVVNERPKEEYGSDETASENVRNPGDGNFNGTVSENGQ